MEAWAAAREVLLLLFCYQAGYLKNSQSQSWEIGWGVPVPRTEVARVLGAWLSWGRVATFYGFYLLIVISNSNNNSTRIVNNGSSLWST